jgi:hypothetical protein
MLLSLENQATSMLKGPWNAKPWRQETAVVVSLHFAPAACPPSLRPTLPVLPPTYLVASRRLSRSQQAAPLVPGLREQKGGKEGGREGEREGGRDEPGA